MGEDVKTGFPYKDSTWVIPNPKRPFGQTWCVHNVRAYLGDLRFHYQCQIPAIFRGCYRTLVGFSFNEDALAIAANVQSGKTTISNAMSELKVARQNDYQYVKSFCLSDENKNAIPPKILARYQKDIPLGAGSIDAGKSKLMLDAFSTFYPTQNVTLPSGKTVNMFDYIMTSSPFDFDYSQEQAVLNAFYGTLKPTSQGKFDSNSANDCNEFREPRLGVDDVSQNYCLPKTPKLRAFFSIGR